MDDIENKNLTQDEIEDLREVYNFRTKSEKLSWSRQEKQIQAWISEELEPLQQKILLYTKEKEPILDKINKKRQHMVKDCVHPRAYLTHCGTHIECGFCFSKIHVAVRPEKNDKEN